jgi:hypothetical protein
MIRQLDFLEDIADSTSFAPNPGERSPNAPKRVLRLGISPMMLHAKVAREASPVPIAAETSPVDSAGSSEGIPRTVPRTVTTHDELVEMLRARRDELEITHEVIDDITGWASGYASKVLSPEPLRNIGERALSLLLKTLALGIAKVEFVEDPELAARMRPRWTKRRRPPMRTRRTRSALKSALLSESPQQTVASTTEDTTSDETPHEFSSEPGSS